MSQSHFQKILTHNLVFGAFFIHELRWRPRAHLVLGLRVCSLSQTAWFCRPFAMGLWTIYLAFLLQVPTSELHMMMMIPTAHRLLAD